MPDSITPPSTTEKDKLSPPAGDQSKPDSGSAGTVTPTTPDTSVKEPSGAESGTQTEPSDDKSPSGTGDSITVTNSKHYSGKLLKRYYDARPESSIGIGTQRFELLKGKFGTSRFVQKNPETGKSEIQPIPLDATNADIKDVFAECYLVRSYSDGRILIRAIFPHESMTPDEEHEFTTLGIFDREDQLVAVLCCKPVDLHRGRTFVIESVIETNIA